MIFGNHSGFYYGLPFCGCFQVGCGSIQAHWGLFWGETHPILWTIEASPLWMHASALFVRVSGQFELCP